MGKPINAYIRKQNILRNSAFVLSSEEIRFLLNATLDYKNYLLLKTAYTLGLTASAILALRMSNFNYRKQEFLVIDKNSRKISYPLPTELFLEWRRYLWKYQPQDYLFFSEELKQPLSILQAEQIFQQSGLLAGIVTQTNFNSLAMSQQAHRISRERNRVFWINHS